MTTAPRVLAIIASRVLFGQERANLLVLEELQARGCEVLAVVEDHPSFQIMVRELTLRSIPYVKSPMVGRRHDGYVWDFAIGNPLRYLRANALMSRWINEFQPTHFHLPNPFNFLTFMISFNCATSLIYRIGDKPITHNAFWRWLWRRIIKRVDRFVANSHFIARELENLGVPKGRISVIYNAPTRRAAPAQPDRAPDHSQHILFIGQLTTEKGLDRLISAFRKVTAEFPEARLSIAGGISPGENWARSLQEQTLNDTYLANKVRFLGEIENVYGFLASGAFLIVPSVCEDALPNVVVEAKAAARPSVVFPRGGLPELIDHGKDGFICRDASVEALVDGMRYYLENSERARVHGRAALASLTRLGVHEFASRWRDVYDSTMTDHQSSTSRRSPAHARNE